MSFLPSFLRRPASPFASPSFVYILLFHPITTFFTFLHYLLLSLRGVPYRPPPTSIPIQVTCISDTHSKVPNQQLPPGDLLIHAGDLTNRGTLGEIQLTIDWLKSYQKVWYASKEGFRHIVVICGNHDSYFDERSRSAHDKRQQKIRSLDWGKIIYLEHSAVKLPFPGDRTLRVYGAPQIPKCGGKEFAFQYNRDQDAWTNTIPDDVDILVTHNPSKWHLDIPANGGLGDENELKEVWRVKPTLHVCGHVHSGAGKEYLWWDQGQKLYEQLQRTAFGGDKAKQQGLVSLFGEVFNFNLAVTGWKMVLHDFRGLLWTRLWGGVRNGSIAINAALTVGTSDDLGNKVQTCVL